MMLGSIEKLIMMDMSSDMINLLKSSESNVANSKIETSYMVGDEEFLQVKEKYDSSFVFSNFLLSIFDNLFLIFFMKLFRCCD